MSVFADAGEIAPQLIWEGVLARAVHGDAMTLTLVELEPNAVVPEHGHVNEQLGVVIEGSVRFTIADETRELGPGGTWRILANVPHSVVTGPAGAVLLEVFSPTRSDWAVHPPLDPRQPLWPETS